MKPAPLIRRSLLSIRALAHLSGLDKNTISSCKLNNRWPKQKAKRNQLRKALGLEVLP